MDDPCLTLIEDQLYLWGENPTLYSEAHLKLYIRYLEKKKSQSSGDEKEETAWLRVEKRCVQIYETNQMQTTIRHQRGGIRSLASLFFQSMGPPLAAMALNYFLGLPLLLLIQSYLFWKSSLFRIFFVLYLAFIIWERGKRNHRTKRIPKLRVFSSLLLVSLPSRIFPHTTAPYRK